LAHDADPSGTGPTPGPAPAPVPGAGAASASGSHLQGQIKALAFDVFGTVVDWRTTVTETLQSYAEAKLSSLSSSSHASQSQNHQAYLARLRTLTTKDWSLFAQQWRDSYKVFTRSFRPGKDAWKDVDAHHRDSLCTLLTQWRLGEADGNVYVYAADEIDHLSRVWHRLRPWPDSAAGLHALVTGGYTVSTLSNGNRELLRDLNAQGGEDGLGFQRLISAEDFGAYKPNPRVYRGACEMLLGGNAGGGGGGRRGRSKETSERKEEDGGLGLSLGPRTETATAPGMEMTGTGTDPETSSDTGQVAMVAAHLGDLAAARACGMQTVYVEREREEDWGPGEDRWVEARSWVDMWVGIGEGGIQEVARRLGC